MMIHDYLRLLAYDDWANQQVVIAMRSAATVPERALQRFGHLVAAKETWLARIVGTAEPETVWPALTLEEIEARARAAADAWSSFLSSTAPERLNGVVHYHNRSGEACSSALADILMHLVVHGSYHRGQIAADLGASGATPAATDFILAARLGRLP